MKIENKTLYYCPDKVMFCITESCPKGKELASLPDFEVPVISRPPSPGIAELGIPEDPEWNDPSVWTINEPQNDKTKYFLTFEDGSNEVIIGHIGYSEGCE